MQLIVAYMRLSPIGPTCAFKQPKSHVLVLILLDKSLL
jgi:hypothetical protein